MTLDRRNVAKGAGAIALAFAIVSVAEGLVTYTYPDVGGAL